MKKSWFAVIGMILILLLPGTMAAAADNITVAGQFEGAYADNVYRFVTADGQEIPAMMEHAGKIMSYTPFRRQGMWLIIRPGSLYLLSGTCLIGIGFPISPRSATEKILKTCSCHRGRWPRGHLGTQGISWDR